MFTNECLSFFDIGRFGRTSIFVARDGPDWFVGNNNLRNIFFADFVKTVGELAIDSRGSFAVFAFHGGFADAKNRGKAIAESGGNFLSDVFFGLIKDITAFRVANDGIIDKTAKLRDGCFAGESAIVAPIEVLGGKFELSTVDLKREGL